MKRFRDQRGVAMVTVLLVGASLTAVTTVATFATIRDFRAGNDDRKGAAALAYAEAGVDRFIAAVKSNKWTYGQMNSAGCGANPPLSLPSGTIGEGTFQASLTVYDPFATGASRFPPAACSTRPIKPHPGQDGADKTYLVITSTGRFPAATRVVRQVVAIQPVGLPVGIYANTITKQSAKHTFLRVSMTAADSITNRSSLDFSGNDPYYLVRDFFPNGVNGLSPIAPIPAAAHAVTGIFTSSSSPEFTGGADGTKNCTVDLGGQSIFDSDGSAGSGTITSGCTQWPGGSGVYPTSSKFTSAQLANIATPVLSEQDYQALKAGAKASGVFCSFPGAGGSGGTQCYRQGVLQAGSTYDAYIQQVLASGTNNVLAYFEFRSGVPTDNNIGSLGTVWGCSDDGNPNNDRSLVAIVRNGGVDYGGVGGDMINGAILMDGKWQGQGKLTFNGSLISQNEIHFHSSSETFSLDDCWVKNMPSLYFKVIPGHWSEVDR